MNPYPKPSATGGTLIRKVLALFKEQKFKLPFQKPILIAVSGGLDSMMLAHLITRYGRKIVNPDLITFLHFDHGWRPESQTTERLGVETLAQELGVKFIHRKLEVSAPSSASANLENDARQKRLLVYDELAGPGLEYEYVLTAHHLDDLAETLFWRFLRGEFMEYSEGILFQDTHCLRPLLKVLKEELKAYAFEEKVAYYEDPSNLDTSAFRAWYRHEMKPALERKFPHINETIARYSGAERTDSGSSQFDCIQALAAQRLDRSQRKRLENMVTEAKVGDQLILSGGVEVTRTATGFLIENLDRPQKI